jgi:hypothetical protein
LRSELGGQLDLATVRFRYDGVPLVAARSILASGTILVLWRSGLPPSGLVLPTLVAGVAWLLQWAGYHYAIAATSIPLEPEHSVVAAILSNVGGLLRLTPGNVVLVRGSATEPA